MPDSKIVFKKVGDDNYTLYFYEYYQDIGYRLLFTEPNWSADAANFEYDADIEKNNVLYF